MSPTRIPVPLTLALAAALAAGCLQVPGETAAPSGGPADASAFEAFSVPEPDFDFSTVVDPDHGAHEVGSLHTGGYGLALAGHTGIGDILPEGTHGSITSIDVWGDYAVVAGMEGGLGFAIVDIADPSAPKALSYWPSPAAGWTARFSDDGNYVFYGCQIVSGVPFVPVPVRNPTPTMVYGDCRGSAEPDPTRTEEHTGIEVVDVTDKAAPKFVTYTETNRAHNLFVERIAGFDHVFTDAVEILKFDPANATLELVAEVPGVHDATVEQHAITGDWLLYTGTNGFSIYNVNDPSGPEPLYEGGLEGVVGWHEQTVIPGLVEGRVLLAVGGETFSPLTGGGVGELRDALFMVDVTDPTNPVPLGEWQPPFAPATPWVSYLYSIHEMAATPQGQLAIAWYHAGVWVLDVSTLERAAAPVTVAAFQPSERINVLPSHFAQTPVPVVPFVWGVNWDDRGYLVVPDMHTGVYVLEPDWGLVPMLDGGN